ncbi:class I glutamine amidotransferase-like protein [Pholiota conissans]|uniref:Class I glutamine amidotransferase-like protein n=1 Tax=Pholiota conissans TaxID=109636 RepID=A0A9P6CXP4_9AGAR|nr:class I glutamine amidotransferase-like protein [Pholiota conissans]
MLTTANAAKARILIYSATRDFRHDSIPTAIEALKAKQDAINAQFDNTEDQTQFTDDNLSGFDTILFLSTTGEVLDQAGKDAFQKYLDLGGTFVGIHSASDTLRNTTFYINELGALFDYHPVLQNFTVDVVDTTHPSTSMLPVIWNVQDEAYNFKSDPRGIGATVILAANESSYIDTGVHQNQGTPHPLAWFQEKGAGVESGGVAGRSFYTSLGHLNETWHARGISWVLSGNTTRAFNSSGLVGNAQSDISGSAQSNSNAPSKTGSTSSTSTTGNSQPANSQVS